MPFSVDIELTNRCNAKCHFCPRDQTPHEGLMAPEVFEQSLLARVEYRDVAADLLDETVSDQPLRTRRTAAQSARADVRPAGAEAGFDGLDVEQRIDAQRGEGSKRCSTPGSSGSCINVGDEGEEYESVYKLPFEKTRDNVVRFAEMAEGRCEVNIVLVDHRRDPEHIEAMQKYWRQHGITRFYSTRS